MPSKVKNKIQIKFIGQSATEVTGSCVWVKTPHIEFLIECGLYQSSGKLLTEYKINNAPFPFKPKNISYVFGCHCHGDHILRVPLLYKKGMEGEFIMPENSYRIAQILMEDSARIMSCDATELSKEYERDYAPIYSHYDVDNALSHLREYPMEETIVLNEYLKFKFIPSGHIFGAAQIEIYVTEGNLTKVIAYTSDLGNTHISQYYANKFKPLGRSNIFIGETTYGGEDRIATQRVRNKDLEKLKNTIIDTCVEKKGRVLIPCFANSRSQVMLTHLYEIFGQDKSFHIPIIFDTPMGIRVCEAYRNILTGADLRLWDKVLHWNNVKFISEPSESKAYREKQEPAVIISSSGMLTHGRSRAYTKAMLGNENNAIVFCGFSVENSLAAIIKKGDRKFIKFDGKRYANRCRVIDLHSFSSHMQKDSLLDYYGNVDCEKIILVHGDMEGKQEFQKELEERLSKNNKTSKVVWANKGYSISI